MSTPISTPVRQAKLGIASRSSLMANEYKKLLNEQHQRLWTKHQQDLDLIDDIRSYVKARLSIERDYSSSLAKLAKQHSNVIAKKFTLLDQCELNNLRAGSDLGTAGKHKEDLDASDSRLQKRLANSGQDEPESASSLYRVWSEHISRLQATTKNRADQFEQLVMVVDKLKDIRSHKASIGKKCLDNHLKRIHEDLVLSMVDVDRAKKLYHEDESQAKKARENEEKARKKRSGLLTKFTDLQAKKEKTSAQREANDIQSTQARNDYIMALSAANAHLQHYFNKDLHDFIHIIDDGSLDHCKLFMATVSECDINSLKDSLSNAQYWSKMINLTGSQKTNSLFLESEQSACLRGNSEIPFEPCNDDPIRSISLDHNADYALQHEVDKWFTWFKKECRNHSHLVHLLETCKRAIAEGRKTIELHGQNIEDLESKVIELKQQMRKCEAAKSKAQARLTAIKEGGMQIEEWNAVEMEIRADMARAQEELAAKRSKEMTKELSNDDSGAEKDDLSFVGPNRVQLHVSRGSDDSDVADSSLHNLAPVSRSASNYEQRQANPASSYSAFTDPSLVWQDDPQSAWGNTQSNYNVVVTDSYGSDRDKDTFADSAGFDKQTQDSNRYDLLSASNQQNSQQVSQQQQQNQQNNPTNSMTVQSSSPLSAIVDGGGLTSPSLYPGMISEAYKSDYECDYNRTGHAVTSSTSSADPYYRNTEDSYAMQTSSSLRDHQTDTNEPEEQAIERIDSHAMLDRRVVALYPFEKSNDDDLAFEQNAILRVVAVDDPDWARAVNESTGEEGYVPTSYIRLLEEEVAEDKPYSADPTMVSDTKLADVHKKSSISQAESTRYCRAAYDYEPEEDTFEDDGLPHLALVQGELLKMISLDEHDGWLLVEKDSGELGHVPSMLVEELKAGEEEDGEEEEEEDEEGSAYSDFNDDPDNSIKAMPNFDPPALKQSFDDDTCQITVDDNNNPSDLISQEPESNQKSVATSKEPSRLVPTSFIIIEPTPEVESKNVEDLLVAEPPDECTTNGQPCEDGPIVHGDKSKPPSDVSYSVVDESFVLESPLRRPIQSSELGNQELQENPALESELKSANVIEGSSQSTDDRPPTASNLNSPAVFIDSYEGDANMDDLDEEISESYDTTKGDFGHQSSSINTGGIDQLHQRKADEFSQQIISEAISFAYGLRSDSNISLI